MTSGRSTRFGTKKRASQREMKSQPGLSRACNHRSGLRADRLHRAEGTKEAKHAADVMNGTALARKKRRSAISKATKPPTDAAVAAAV